MDYFTDRMKEKASHGGLGLVAVGLIILFCLAVVTLRAASPKPESRRCLTSINTKILLSCIIRSISPLRVRKFRPTSVNP